jgi:hypothetical protein
MLTSWKTTLAGLIAGLPIAANAILTAYDAGAFTGKTGLQLVGAIGIVLFGLFAKDHDVTGGTKPNTAVTKTTATPLITK